MASQSGAKAGASDARRKVSTRVNSDRRTDANLSTRSGDGERSSRRRGGEGRGTSSSTSGGSGSSGGSSRPMNFEAQRIVDNGSFGVVFQATVKETGEIVAIKKVLQDRRFKNRELQIMKMLKHPCICELKSFFYSNGDKSDELYLNLVLEFVPKTVYKVAQAHIKRTRMVPRLHIKLYMYQVRCRSSCLCARRGRSARPPAGALHRARSAARAPPLHRAHAPLFSCPARRTPRTPAHSRASPPPP